MKTPERLAYEAANNRALADAMTIQDQLDDVLQAACDRGLVVTVERNTDPLKADQYDLEGVIRPCRNLYTHLNELRIEAEKSEEA